MIFLRTTNFLRVLLMSTVLSTGMNMVAMEPTQECAEPVQKRAKATNEEYTGAEPMEIEPAQRLPQTIMVTLQSHDGQTFKINLQAALRSETIKNLIEDAGVEDPIPLPNINGKTLAKVVTILNRMAALPRDQFEDFRRQTLTYPKIKKLKGDVAFALSYLDIPMVMSAVTSDGDGMLVPLRSAQLSKTLKNLIADVNLDDSIPLPNIDTETMVVLIELMAKLDSLVEQSKENNLLYIPRAFQPMVNQALHNKNIEQVLKVFLAANYLDIPFILNGVAAVIADRIPQETREKTIEILLLPAEEKDKGKADLDSLELHYIADFIPHFLWKYIARHLVHRRCGIAQERSIADYIVERGQPRLELIFSEFTLDLDDIALTSLFGINSLQNATQATSLDINDNCLFDLSLDFQGIKEPFNNFKKLRHLSLNRNQLEYLPAGIFDGFENLLYLSLNDNRLKILQPNTFNNLASLRNLAMVGNQLKNLPSGIFAKLSNLRELFLDENQLNNLPSDIFRGLNVNELSLGDNQLSNLPVDIFDGLDHMNLGLSDNQLSEEEKDNIEKRLAERSADIAIYF